MLNLFLALLLNAFASDTLRGGGKEEDDENNKLVLAFKRLKEMFCCCLNRKKRGAANTVSPDIDETGNEVVAIQELKDGGKQVNSYKKWSL